MNARAAAAQARARLAAAGISDATFEAEYLVREASGLSRATYYLDPALDSEAMERLDAAVARRERREPATYITGHREFWGLDFAVGPGVLVPRPETELLVEIALVEVAEAGGDTVVVDVGTGSGCVAVATEVASRTGSPSIPTASGGHGMPEVVRQLAGRDACGSCSGRRTMTTVVATDVSREALAYARTNAERHGATVRFVLGDLATAVRRADVVLANLPYIATEEIDALEPEVSAWEPRVALDGGGDGFDLIRRLVADCAERLRPRLLALEVGYGMAGEAEAIAAAHGASTSIVKDLAGIDRVVCCRWA